MNALRDNLVQLRVRFYLRLLGTLTSVAGYAVLWYVDWRVAAGCYLLSYAQRLKAR